LNTHEERAPDYVEHIAGAIDQINVYVLGVSQAQFFDDRLIQDGVLRQLMVIGEACSKLLRQCPAFTASHPEVAWRSAYDTRNVLVHLYTDIDLEVVWKIVREELPLLRRQMQALLDSLQK
jgi:uncharacterized protein with HEPN domain